ncbi:MAG: PLDc N-terminal domain-containing protein [bacterium]
MKNHHFLKCLGIAAIVFVFSVAPVRSQEQPGERKLERERPRQEAMEERGRAPKEGGPGLDQRIRETREQARVQEERERRLNAFKEELQQREKEIDNHAKDLDRRAEEQERGMNAHREELAQWEQKIHQREAELEERDRDLNRREEELGKKMEYTERELDLRRQEFDLQMREKELGRRMEKEDDDNEAGPLVAILLILGIVLWIWALGDCLTRPDDTFPTRGPNDKLAWALVILFTFAIGAALYVFRVKRRSVTPAEA